MLTAGDRRILETYATRAVLAIVIARVLSAERERLEAEGRLRASELREAGRRETLRRVVDAQEHERRRIARELHDETGQALTSVLLGLRLIEEVSPDVRAAVSELRETITAAIQELRALAVELRPKALDDFGLGSGHRAAGRHLFAPDRDRRSTCTWPACPTGCPRTSRRPSTASSRRA